MAHYSMREMIQDYNLICIQFGYVTIFAAAVPFGPILLFAYNYWEIRIDGWKLLTSCR